MTTPSSRSGGGTGLLVTVAAATIVTVALEAAFIAVGSWTLLPLIVLVIVVMALGVVHATVRLLDDGQVVSAPRRDAVEASEAAPAARPVPARPALGR